MNRDSITRAHRLDIAPGRSRWATPYNRRMPYDVPPRLRMTRLTRAWGALAPEQRIAAIAAAALLVTMFFPWYELQSLNRKTGVINSHSISAFGDVSFVEAAVFLVAAGVVALLFARAERKDFHVPGSDGAIVMAAGGWAALLIFYRVFSRPAGHGYPVGIQWGFFLAFVAAGALTYAGWRMRATSTPEPPLVRPRARRRPPPDEDITVLAPPPSAWRAQLRWRRTAHDHRRARPAHPRPQRPLLQRPSPRTSRGLGARGIRQPPPLRRRERRDRRAGGPASRRRPRTSSPSRTSPPLSSHQTARSTL